MVASYLEELRRNRASIEEDYVEWAAGHRESIKLGREMHARGFMMLHELRSITMHLRLCPEALCILHTEFTNRNLCSTAEMLRDLFVDADAAFTLVRVGIKCKALEYCLTNAASSAPGVAPRKSSPQAWCH